MPIFDSGPFAPAAVPVNDWMQTILNSPQYNAGGTKSGLTSQKALSALNALGDQLGIPIAALLGGTVGQDVAVPSQTGAVYGSNPVFKDMFAYMDAGDDPMVAFNKVKKNQEDSKKYGDGVDFDDTDTSGKFLKIAEDYKFETVKNQADAKNTYTVAGKQYKGSGDILAKKSQFELLGSPTEEQLIKSYLQTKKRPPVSAQDVFNRGFKNDATAGMRPEYLAALQRIAPQILGATKMNMIQSDAGQNLARQILGLKTVINPIG
jgi:hypothetical protein